MSASDAPRMPRVGDIWASTGKRDLGRRVTVLEAPEDAYGNGFVVAQGQRHSRVRLHYWWSRYEFVSGAVR